MVPTMRTLAGALLAAPAVALLVSAAVAPVASTPTATADVPVVVAPLPPLTQEYCDAHYGQPVGEVFTWRTFTFQTYLGDARCETHRQGTYLALGRLGRRRRRPRHLRAAALHVRSGGRGHPGHRGTVRGSGPVLRGAGAARGLPGAGDGLRVGVRGAAARAVGPRSAQRPVARQPRAGLLRPRVGRARRAGVVLLPARPPRGRHPRHLHRRDVRELAPQARHLGLGRRRPDRLPPVGRPQGDHHRPRRPDRHPQLPVRRPRPRRRHLPGEAARPRPATPCSTRPGRRSSRPPSSATTPARSSAPPTTPTSRPRSWSSATCGSRSSRTDHQHDQPTVVDLVDDPEVARAHPPLARSPDDAAGLGRSWVVGQQLDGRLPRPSPTDARSIRSRQPEVGLDLLPGTAVTDPPPPPRRRWPRSAPTPARPAPSAAGAAAP